jgi:hypothetical protein
VTFTKINVDKQTELARAYGVTAMPTFMIFKNARNVQTIKGADRQKLSEVVKKLASGADAAGDAGADGFGEDSMGGGMWLGAALPRGYRDVTDQVKTLFDGKTPSALDTGKGKGEHMSDLDAELSTNISCSQRRVQQRLG